MCLLKLNHHDLTSKIHTVKSYKVTQAEDEIKRSKWTLRVSCTICSPYLAHAQSFFSSVTLMCNIKDVCCNLVSVKWSIASWMSSKLEPVIWLRVLVTLAYMKGRTDVRTYVRTLYVRTDVHDVMAIKPKFLTSMGYHIFLSMVLRARAPLARAKLR